MSKTGDGDGDRDNNGESDEGDQVDDDGYFGVGDIDRIGGIGDDCVADSDCDVVRFGVLGVDGGGIGGGVDGESIDSDSGVALVLLVLMGGVGRIV